MIPIYAHVFVVCDKDDIYIIYVILIYIVLCIYDVQTRYDIDDIYIYRIYSDYNVYYAICV